MSLSPYRIVLIGAGNVATQLGIALQQQHTILQVVSRSESSSKALANKLECEFTSDFNQIDTSADIYIIAVSDDAIAEVSSLLNLPNKIVVHTSGTMEMGVLSSTSDNYGVLYPLQTFSKEKSISFSNVPFCLEASNDKTSKDIKELAKSISDNVQFIDSKQRKRIHVAAVFACNFTNHFYNISAKMLAENNISFDLLKPLIQETAKKAMENHPSIVQTGPAIRGDEATMNEHLDMIEDEQYKLLYEYISKSIRITK